MPETLEQLNKVIDAADRILITGPQSPSIDALSTAAAWWLFLTQKRKVADLVFAGTHPKIDYLPSTASIKTDLDKSSGFKIILNITDIGVKQLSYDVKDGKLEIDIVPKTGNFKQSNLRTEQMDLGYDLIVALGAINLQQLGQIFQEHQDLFHQTPIVNIDSSIINENFGQLNIIDTGKTCLAEICVDFFKDHLNEDMATCLLGGIVAATGSFQSAKVTPQTLEVASQLIIKGARREKVMEALYRTKDMETLKNWGRVLSRLKKHGHVITSFLKHDEIDSLPHYFRDLVRDLIMSTPGVQVVLILYQRELRSTEGWVYARENVDAQQLLKAFGAQGDRGLAKLTVNQDIETTKQMLGDHLEEKLRIINGE